MIHDFHEIERALLSAVLTAQKIDGAEAVEPGDFGDPARAAAWRAIRQQHDKGLPVDARLVGAAMLEAGEPDAVSVIREAASEGAPPANIGHYADLLVDKRIRKRVARVGARLTEAAANGVTTPELLAIAKTEVGRLGEVSGIDGVRFERITSTELDEGVYEVEYLIPDMLVARQPGMFAGPRKGLKTSFMVDMGVALATGGYWLGRFPVARAARVGMMSGESGIANLQDTARRVCKAAGINLADVGDNLVWSTMLPKLSDPAHLLGLERFINDDGLEVLVIDPAYLAMPGADAGNLFLVGELLQAVSEVCQRCGTTLLLAHHFAGKPDFDPPDLDKIAWAGYREFARQWFLVGRREKYVEGTGEHALWLSVGGSMGHSSLHAIDVSEGVYTGPGSRWWSVTIQNPTEARQDAEERIEEAKRQREQQRIEADAEKLLKAAARFPDGETQKRLAELAGMSGTRARAPLAMLVDDGRLVPCDVVKPNRRAPYAGFRLRDQRDTSNGTRLSHW